MELSKQEQQGLIDLLMANSKAIKQLSGLNLKTIDNVAIVKALREFGILGENDNDSEFIEQVYIILDESKITIKEYKRILSKIAYQIKQGNVRSIKGYTLNALAKETKQATYK